MIENSICEVSNQQVSLHIYPSVVRALAACNVNFSGVLESLPNNDRLGNFLKCKKSIPVDKWLYLTNAITHTVAHSEQAKHFPIEFAKTFSFDFLSEFSVFALSCKNIQEATRLLDWIPPFVCPVVRFEIIERSASVAFRVFYQHPYDEPTSAWAMTETIFATIYQFWKPIAFQGISPLGLRLQHMPHQRSAALREFMGCAITYEQGVNELEISKQVFYAPIHTANRDIRDFTQKKITTQTLPRILNSTNKRSLHQLIRLSEQSLQAPIVNAMLQLYESEPQMLGFDLVLISKKLGMSRRTLQRKLAQANTSYRKVCFEARLALAKQFLSNEILSLQLICEMLGFSEISEFNVFFKQAEGISPRMWRTRGKA